MNSSSLALPSDPPSWATLTVPRITYQTVGISRDGDFYLYSETGTDPNKRIIPSVTGCVTGISTSSKGASSPHGAREYLDLRMNGLEPSTGLILSLPSGRGSAEGGDWVSSWSVKTLLGRITQVDLAATAVTLTTERGTKGNRPTFIQVFAHGPHKGDLFPVEDPAIDSDRDSLEIAINRVRALLGQPALFDGLTASSDDMQPIPHEPHDL